MESAGDSIPLLIAGDLNIALNSELDTHNYVRENNVRARDRLVQMMGNNNMIDVFREMNGSMKRYTWRVRNPILKQARLDYFLTSELMTAYIQECNIVPGYRTDHSMLKMKLNINEQVHGKGFFKLNLSLIKDDVYVKKVKQTIEQTVFQYALPVYSREFMAEHGGEVVFAIKRLNVMGSAYIKYPYNDSYLWHTEETANEKEGGIAGE